MIKYLKSTFKDEQATTDEYVRTTVQWHGRRAVLENQNYQIDRVFKQTYIKVNIFAEGYDQKRFIEFMVKQKNTTPNVDYFTREEVKTMVREFKEKCETGELDRVARSNSILNDSTANMFDEALQRRRSNSVLKRRMTGVAEENVLTSNSGSVCLIAGVNQYVTSKMGGWSKETTMMITVDTFPMKWRVKRLDSDFQILRDYLLKMFPQVVIPPLPKPKAKKELAPRQLVKRQSYYQRFLNSVLRSQVLKTSTFLVDFLRENNQDSFNLRLLSIEQETGPRNIYEFKTITGEIEVEHRRKAAKFCDQLPKFQVEYAKIAQYIAGRCKTLSEKAHNLADDYFAVGAEINHFAELMKLTEIPQAHKFYRRLSDLVVRHGDHTIRSGELMNQNLAAWFKYMREESNSYQEANWLREESMGRFNAQRIDLYKRKEKLFRRKDVTEWGCPPDQMRAAMDTLGDATAAYDYMLPNASKQVNYLGEESAFFQTQCFKETRRTTMINYTMAREHFIDMGEQVHKHIYDINLAWGQFLDFYSDLNNARKAHEDNFVERNSIGEELVEPDEKQGASDNFDLVDDFQERVKEDKDPRKDFFEAFDDGFDTVSHNSSKSIVEPTAKSQNMLGELTKEIVEEEEKAAAVALVTGKSNKSKADEVHGDLLLEDQITEDNGVLQIEEEFKE